MFEIASQDMDMALRLILASVLGGVIGLERQRYGKAAGFRTYTLVALGSALLMLVSIQVYTIYKESAIVDPSRIAAQVVTGIGFLGAGAIIRFPQRIEGLTTAAGIWIASGIGLACGLGQFRSAIFTTLLALATLTIFSKLSRMITHKKKA